MLAANPPTSARLVADARDPHPTSTALDASSHHLQARIQANAQKIGTDYNEKTLPPPCTPHKATWVGRDNESKEIPKQLHTANTFTSSKHPVICPNDSDVTPDIDEASAAAFYRNNKALERYRLKLNCFLVIGSLLSLVYALAIVGSYFLSEVDRGKFIDALLDLILAQPAVDTRLYHTSVPLMILNKFMIITALIPGFFSSAQIVKSANRRKQALRNYERGGELVHHSDFVLEWLLLGSVWLFFMNAVLFGECSIHRVVIIRTASVGSQLLLVICIVYGKLLA